MKKEFNYEIIVVHAGKFHADDAMCVALAQTIKPSIRIIRTNSPEQLDESILNKTIICDIGRGEYDHHGEHKYDENGHEYAACGLFFKDFGHLIFKDEECRKSFNKNYIIPLEDADNGKAMNPLSTFISSMNPTWDDPFITDDSTDEDTYRYYCFKDAVHILIRLIGREKANEESLLKAKIEVEKSLKNMKDNIVILDKYYPWKHVLVPTDAKFIIYPSQRRGYNLQVVPKQADDFSAKEPLPKKWLEEKPKGCTFVHLGLFLSSFDSIEEAVDAIQKDRIK